MIASTMLQSKILRTKKRLYDDQWQLRVCVIALLGLFCSLSFALRATFVGSSYGIVETELPAISVSVNDPDPKVHDESARATINETTPLVILTANEFFFGDINAFTKDFVDVRNKFFIKHQKGAPNIALLNKTMAKWLYTRSEKSDISQQGIAMLLPDGDVPASIVIQTIAGMKQSPYINQVVLASGIL